MKLGGILALTVALVLTGCAPAAIPADPNLEAKAQAYEARVKADMKAENEAAIEAQKVAVSFGQEDPLRLLMIGDSLQVGAFASIKEKGFAPLVVDELSKHGPVEPSMFSKGGVTVGEVSEVVPSPVPAADLAILELSTNDLYNEPPTEIRLFTDQYRMLLERVKDSSPEVQILCLGTWAAPTSVSEPYIFAIRKACEDIGGKYVDTSALYMDESLRGPAGIPAFGGISDVGHPNDAGHRKLADLVMSRIKFNS